MPKPAGVFDLALLGRLDLRDPGGAECRQLLRRPKLVALLAYLAAARPHGFHRRDSLVAVFWPDLDQQHARNALRQAVHHLRAALSPDVVQTRGDEELALDSARIRCDLVVFREMLSAGRATEALEMAGGELLPGFHLSDTPDFERWLDDEREHLRRQVVLGATEVARQEKETGNLVRAGYWARRAVEAVPYDEEALRLLLSVLDLAGDRAGAVAAYKKFTRRLEDELGVEPAPETRAMLDAICSRIDPTSNGHHAHGGASKPPSPGAIPDQDQHRRRSAPGRGRQMLVRFASGIVVAAGVGSLWALSFLSSGADRTAVDDGLPSLAVLPLHNYSDDLREDYVADGITEELIGELGRIGGLRVVSRTSVARFKDTELPIAAIADSLGVEHLIEGSVARKGDRIRLRLQLIAAKPETHVWTDAYERGIEDFLLLEREVAQAVARALGVADTSSPLPVLLPPPVARPDAFDAYLRGLHSYDKLELDRARQQFDLAIRLDSTYAPAYAALSKVYLSESAFGSVTEWEAYTRGKALAERALALDPLSVEAHVALAGVYETNWEWPAAEGELRRAIEINPSHPTARIHYAHHLCLMGRHPDAILHATEARRIDPLSPVTNRGLGETLLCSGRFEEAIEHFQLMAELGMPSWEDLSYAYLAAGRGEEGLRTMLTAEEQFFPDPDRSEELAVAYAMAGHPAEARRILRNIAQDSIRVGPVTLALVWAHLGDVDQAFQYLEQAYERHDPWLLLIRFPMFAPLWREQRYSALIQRMGLPDLTE